MKLLAVAAQLRERFDTSQMPLPPLADGHVSGNMLSDAKRDAIWLHLSSKLDLATAQHGDNRPTAAKRVLAIPER